MAGYLTADLEAEGAKVVLTRHSNDGVGPCVNTRARIIDRAHANVAVDIHADGGPPSGRGFTILEPVADKTNAKVIGASDRFAKILRSRFASGTGMPVSTYDGVDGLQPRDDLAGLNLTTVPKVLIECGNMRNATDAKLLVTSVVSEAGGGGDRGRDSQVPGSLSAPNFRNAVSVLGTALRKFDSGTANSTACSAQRRRAAANRCVRAARPSTGPPAGR